MLNYLSDCLEGARAYSDWVNGDLYELTSEQFGICIFPGKFQIFPQLLFKSTHSCNIIEPLCMHLEMVQYSEESISSFPKLNSNDDWLQQHQGLALLVLPPTTPEARQYFFSKIRSFANLAIAEGKGKINFEAFSQEWNRTADGKGQFYITTEVLSAYAKSWETVSNIKALQDMISDKIGVIDKTQNVFSAPEKEFPDFLMSTPRSSHPRQGVLDLDNGNNIPQSISLVPSL